MCAMNSMFEKNAEFARIALDLVQLFRKLQ